MTPFLFTLSFLACFDERPSNADLHARLSALEAENAAQSQALGILQDDAQVQALLSRIEAVEHAQAEGVQPEDLRVLATQDWASERFASREAHTDLVVTVDGVSAALETFAGHVVDESRRSDVQEARLDDLRVRMNSAEEGLGRVSGAQDLLRVLSVSADGDLVLSRANLYVQNGDGATDAPVNGKGNIILGYDENVSNDKSGSHNLILGMNHSYTSYGGVLMGKGNAVRGEGGLVSGQGNQVEGNHAAALGGTDSEAAADHALVLGGVSSVADGTGAVVVGGSDNVASGSHAVVSGGQENEASGTGSTVSGGYRGLSDGRNSAIAGGRDNTATGSYAVVSGGAYGDATGQSSSVTGGYFSLAQHAYSTAVGGDNIATTSRYAVAHPSE